ncbi:MAG: HAMP domain-containing histidine kinase [Eubacterium sp.]|nr:HAMP domain-containing histidine kinase [Eubacterium sp.]
MKKKLLLKIILAYFATGILCFLLISTLGSSMIYRRIVSGTSRRLYNEAVKIANYSGRQLIADEESMNRSLSGLKTIAVYENARIWYISPQGEILLDTDDAHKPGSSEVLNGFNPVAFGTNYYTLGRFFNYFESDMLSVMVPAASGLQIRGYLAIHIPVTELVAERESIVRVVLLIFLILYAVILLYACYVIWASYRPLLKIIQGVKECAGGNLERKIDVNTNDEYGDLAQSINFLLTELRESEESQRAFISNVSHDFRSPLTSIKGYVQAMLDGTIPTEMQERYLNIVLNETKRLEKLTSGILMLNNINNKETQLDISTFDINRVIKDTSASFEGTCMARQISIELILAGAELSVSADYGKIQQVLYNLLDNAIKFSSNHSVIQIETSIRHDKVYISVKDHGIGIPPSEITKIWERFYKIDASRGNDTKGTGLGLAIVRDIINAHGQTIDVISTEQAGTEFIFSLARG